MRALKGWIVALLAIVAVFVSAIVFAQSQTPQQPPLRPFAQRRLPASEYQMLSGPDVAFRIEGWNANGRPTGRWMIRVDNEWVEPASTVSARPLTN